MKLFLRKNCIICRLVIFLQFFLILNAGNAQVTTDTTSLKSITQYFPKSDGRFTLGVDGRRLMFGYPFPYSTSHFVVKVEDKFASNYAGFGWQALFRIKRTFLQRVMRFLFRIKDDYFVLPSAFNDKNLSYLRDTLEVIGTPTSSYRMNIRFKFSGIDIYQKLTPVDANLNQIGYNRQGQYYKVEYIFVNTSDTAKSIGLLTMYDTMMDNNDACSMEAFNGELANNLKEYPKQKIGFEKHFETDAMPDRLMVYENKVLKRAGLTGDIHFRSKGATPPDDLFIGPWPYYNSVVWNYQTSANPIKYYDSAILMKWKDRIIAAHDTLRIYTFYGLYNKGFLRLVPSANNTQMLTFEAVPDHIYSGEKSTLKWKTDSTFKADIVISTNKNKKVPWKGSMSVSPKVTTPYTMGMYQNGKLLSVLPAIVYVMPKKIDTIVVDDYKYYLSDGRFNVGNSLNSRFTFGYPLPFSSSYFVVSVDSLKAANSPMLPRNIKYVTGCRKIGNRISDTSSIDFEFANLDISQTITAVDMRYKPTTFAKANKLKVEYEVLNATNKKIANVGLSVLLDITLNNNDEPRFRKIKQNDEVFIDLNRNEFPDSIIADDSTGIGVAVFAKPGSPKAPNNIMLSSWQYLNTFIINSNNTKNKMLADKAILLNWRKRDLLPGDKIQANFYLSSIKNSDISKFAYANSSKMELHKIYFESNKTNIQKSDIENIKQFIDNKNFDCILVESFCDEKGDDKYNYNLSKRRNVAIRDILLKLGVEKSKILMKSNGEFYAKQENLLIKKSENRIGIITLFFESLD